MSKDDTASADVIEDTPKSVKDKKAKSKKKGKKSKKAGKKADKKAAATDDTSTAAAPATAIDDAAEYDNLSDKTHAAGSHSPADLVTAGADNTTRGPIDD